MNRIRHVRPLILLLAAFLLVVGLTGAKKKQPAASSKKEPKRIHANLVPKGRPWYERMFADGAFRIALFWGWDHPRETIEAVFPAFETLNGKNVYFNGRAARIELGVFTSVTPGAKRLFQNALEDPTIDVVIYSGHARYGGGMAFSDRDDIFRSGNGELIEDRHTEPYRYFQATAEDLQATTFPSEYRIVMLNCCDSDAHFRESWSKRFSECSAPIDLVTVEFPVFNLYDHVRILNFVQDLLTLSDWKTIKKHYDSEVHKRKNRLVVYPVFVPGQDDYASFEGQAAED
ncbi:MAG: hypothetical protein GX442_06625 [Candidatus Riflebacteria bacterium]|nr:hypothetical protein [Candidatus Riflebacteria bacterium]